tara:strand:- start:596 stop:892 length:297 start_codon:yes stop_codon:yes gene_type:complete
MLIEDFIKLPESDLQVIDVRESYEYQNGHINSINIPMSEILEKYEQIKPNKTVVIYCQTGRRAAAVVYMLKKKFDLNNIFNLSGGYEAYMKYKNPHQN